ncbi:MAG: hypothetical protein U1F83_10735 [Verrucomicrobiota bacterium]
MTLRSYRGPRRDNNQWGAAMRGVYLAAGTTLLGFTVTNGTTSGNGGGVFCELPGLVVSNCVLTGNSATSGSGGGVYGGTIKNCILRGNNGPTRRGGKCHAVRLRVSQQLRRQWRCRLRQHAQPLPALGNYAYSPFTGGGGGGAYGSTLNNCLVISNAAPIWGGGAYGSTLNNCTVVGNYGGQRGAGIFEGTANNSILWDNYINGNVIENFGANYWWQGAQLLLHH